MSAIDDPRELKSRRYVTSGYTNVFHRAFLYGLGLSHDDMQKPFAGLALAHSEAVPGHGLVRALGDAAKQGLSAAGITEREFVVPESKLSSSAGRDAVTARELVADSAELVVRGHWYDALVGVAATVPAAAGLAQSMMRLRIPGLVLVPEERRGIHPALDRLVGLLADLKIGAWVPLDDTVQLRRLMVGLREQIGATAEVEHAADVLRSGVVAAPLLATADLLPHVAALAHEVGIVDMAELMGRAEGTEVLGDPSGRVVTCDQVCDAEPGPLAVLPSQGAVGPRFAAALIAGVVHPGDVVGPLSYDRL